MTSKKKIHPRTERGPGRAIGITAAAILLLAIAAGALWFPHGPTNPARPMELARTNHDKPNPHQILASYAGSAQCRECHPEEYALWKSSHHGLAERLPSPELDSKAFEPARTFVESKCTDHTAQQG